MKLLGTSIISAVSTIAKMAIAFVALKIMAIYIGPSGVALCGQFSTVINILSVIAGGGITYGVIKYVAEYSQSPERLKIFLGNAALYTLLFSALTLLVGIIFHHSLANWIMGSEKYSTLFLLTAFVQVLVAVYLLLIAVLNGFKEVVLIAKTSIIGSVIGVIAMFWLAASYGIKGGLYALLITQMFYLFICLAFVFRKKWFSYICHFKFDRSNFLNLSRYSLMNSVSMLTVPVAQLIVRNDLSSLFGWHDVGFWQAVLRLSDAYIQLMTLVLTAYYIPRLSELSDKQQLKREVFHTHKIMLPALLIIVLIIYLSRDLIINLLYSAEFLPARDLFFYQFVGDFFRVAGWLSACLFIAKLQMKTYILSEIVLSIMFVAISHILVRAYGLVGVTYSFAITYFLYWLLMVAASSWYFRRTSNSSGL